MAIVLATFTLAVQEILYLVYFALLFVNDETELNSLLLLLFFKVALCVTNAFVGFAKMNAALKVMKISDPARLSFFQAIK